MPFAPLGRGFLTGEVKRAEEYPEGDHRRGDPRYQGENFDANVRAAETVREVCTRAASIERVAAGGSADFQRAVTSLRGIGPWTATSVAGIAFGDPDAVVVGDYHLPSIVAWNLVGERKADDARMLELLEPFRPHRARVVALLARAGGHPPRHAPRRALRDIRRI